MRYLLMLCLLLMNIQAMATLIYAHRGSRGLAPENTLPAYQKSLHLGVDYVDMDVAMTRDGHVVVHHDLSLNPDMTRDEKGQWITNANIAINSLTLSQLKKYDVGRIKPGSSYQRFFPEQQAVDNTNIPTLLEVIHFVKQSHDTKVAYQIEMKMDPATQDSTMTPKRFASSIARILKQENILAHTEVQSQDWRCLYALHQINPKIKLAFISNREMERDMSSPNPKIAGFWTGGKLLKDYNYSLPKMIAALGGSIWNPQDIELTAGRVAEAHRYGLKVVPFSWIEQTGIVFDSKMIDKLIAMKVDGIITDRPDLLRNKLIAMHQKVPPTLA